MKPKHQRLVFIAISMVFLCVATLLTMRAFRDNLVFFYSPSEILAQTPTPDKTVRIGGLVKTGSVNKDGEKVEFIITDGKADLTIHFTGMLPTLFREGQGVVAQGALMPDHAFAAKNILAKHDEKYIPKEVVDALKRSGNWHGDGQ